MKLEPRFEASLRFRGVQEIITVGESDSTKWAYVQRKKFRDRVLSIEKARLLGSRLATSHN